MIILKGPKWPIFLGVFVLFYLYQVNWALAETRFLGDYPHDREPGWSSECQGVTHDGSFWYITQNNRLWKFPLSFDLNKDVGPYIKSGIVKYVEIPEELRKQGYNHLGDLDYYQGYLFVPLEDAKYEKPIIIVFRAEDLSYITSAKLDVNQGGGHAMACAINPQNGRLYVSQFKHGKDTTNRVVIYRQEFKNNHLNLIYQGKLALFDESGRREIFPGRIQGLAFSPYSGLLYLVSDTGSSGGIFIFDPVNGQRLQWIKVAYDPTIFNQIKEELEGITVWDLDNRNAPNIKGQVHLIMIDNYGTGDDDLYFKHFLVPGEKHLSGLEDCLQVNFQNLQVRRDGSQWQLTDGLGVIEVFKNEAEAQKAKSIFLYYKINQECFVGRPKSKFNYYLVNGQSPRGTMAGEDCLEFNPTLLDMKWIDNKWFIIERKGESGHRILEFGNEGLECLAALNVIKKYGFTNICFVGRPNASITYFRK